jgi:uncharacterized tellurite resistance protein B-like protein
MLTFAKDPNLAEQQMRAIIFYLTAFGYIDGHFDLRERSFIRVYIRRLVEARAREAMPDADEKVKQDVVQRFVSHFHEVFEEIDQEIRSYFTEVVADGEKLENFLYAKLKLRSYEIFRSFDPENQLVLLESVDELINADGQVHESEARFREEVRGLLDAGASHHLIEASEGRDDDDLSIRIDRPVALPVRREDHPFFLPAEDHYSADPVRIRKQIEVDYQLIVQTMARYDEQRARGRGRLAGVRKVSELDGAKPFLDGHIYVHPVGLDEEFEVIVLGDLHGCYSCLKAALMQSDFFAKVEAHQLDPVNNPNVKLVLLGDYIDRGRFSYNGVLRTVMQLFLSAPEHVYVLRGNHEYYLEYEGRIYGGVRPAEAINTLVNYMPKEMFEAYMNLFESMANVLFFGRVMFVHAGIPRDATLREKYRNLSSLNDPELRFQMLWSDPSPAEYIPESLQAENARFPFGRMQFERFMEEIGCTTMVRGHEKVAEGFRTVYSGATGLLNLFSAGGATNEDLPVDSSYREVTPMAMTMKITSGELRVTPWAIDYARYNSPVTNRFFARPPEIEHKSE